MPPDPVEHDLAHLPPPRPVFLVEQALLGGLLLEPQQLSSVTGIAADSFSTAAHSALFAAINSLPAPDRIEHEKSTTWLNQVLASAREHTRGLTVSYLHALIQTCHRPGHIPAYARMIEAEHARRRLGTAAQRVMHTARDTSLPQHATMTLTEADALATVVDDIAARFPPHSGSLPRTPTPPLEAPHDDEAADEERLLLSTTTEHPTGVARMRWLTPHDFTQPLHAGLWQCLTSLTRRGTPIDPLTVLWEAKHRGLLDAGADPRVLLDVLSGTHGSPEHWGERILQRSLLVAAHHVGRRIEAFTEDPATTPYQFVVGSRRALADLSAVRARWLHATSPAPAPKATLARASAAPRAGPPTTTPAAARISR